MGRLAVHVQQLDDVTCPSAPARQSSTVPPSSLCLQPPQGHLLAGASPGSPGFFVWDVATGTATPISVRRWFISSQPQLMPAGVPLGSTVGCAAGSLLSCWQVGSYRRPSRLRNVAGGPRARVPAALVPLRQLPAGGAAGGRVPHLGDAGAALEHHVSGCLYKGFVLDLLTFFLPSCQPSRPDACAAERTVPVPSVRTRM